MQTNSFFIPDWPCPAKVKAISTYRTGGVSVKPFDSLNLGLHVGDDIDVVNENRRQLEFLSKHPPMTHWLNQTHSTNVNEFRKDSFDIDADGIYSFEINQPCIVMTADCLPVLLCSKHGDFVAALHAGWRGLADGILLNGVASYHSPQDLLAWIGPAISQKYFEVGAEVREYFTDKDSDYGQFFKRHKDQKYLANLAGVAEFQLAQQGVSVYQSGLCTFANKEQFFSYRRDGQTGRMATMVWLEE